MAQRGWPSQVSQQIPVVLSERNKLIADAVEHLTRVIDETDRPLQENFFTCVHHLNMYQARIRDLEKRLVSMQAILDREHGASLSAAIESLSTTDKEILALVPSFGFTFSLLSKLRAAGFQVLKSVNPKDKV